MHRLALAFLPLLAGCVAHAPAAPPTTPAPDIPLDALIGLTNDSRAISDHSGVMPLGYSTSPASIAPAPNGQPVILPIGVTCHAGEWVTLTVAWPGHSLAGLTWFWTAEGGAYPATDTGREFTVRWAVPGRHRVAVLPAGGGEPGIAWVTVE